MAGAGKTDPREDRTKDLVQQVEHYRSEVKRLRAANAKLQQQLAQQRVREEKHRETIENISEGYFETDLAGNVTFCNRAMLRISGYPRNQLMGRNFRELTTPKTARILRAAFGRVMKTGKDAELANYEVFHHLGHTLTIAFAASLIQDTDGRPVGFRAIVRDVSDSVRALEKERRAQAQLQQAQKMEALGTLAGGLAHGFNNMLMAIQGNLTLIRMNLPDDHPMHKHLERINQSTEKGSRLAREILGFAKIGKFVVMPTNLNNILKSTSRMFARSNASLKIREIYEPRLWQARVDRVQIGQVMLSLYMNAADAMPGGGEIYLRSENAHLDEQYTLPHGCKAGQYVKISVTDAGIGLNEEAKRRIFEPFFTPYQPLRYEALGLAAVYGTIRSHNGIISAYSEKGHGTTITLCLPALIKDSRQHRPHDKAMRGSETILVVDDDQVAASVGRDILEGFGYRIIMAASGGEAIELHNVHHRKIHLVLLDAILPDQPADRIVQALKRGDPQVQIVLASGYNVNRQISDLLRRGCTDFIHKPYQTHALSLKIRRALDHRPFPPMPAGRTG